MRTKEKNILGPTIFIAEDDRTIGQSFLQYFDQLKYDCRLFETGIEFMQSADEDFDVAVIDVNLRRIGGFQILMELREKHPNTLVILVSGENIDSHRMEALERGADFFLPKPVKLDVIHQIIDENLHNKERVNQQPSNMNELR